MRNRVKKFRGTSTMRQSQRKREEMEGGKKKTIMERMSDISTRSDYQLELLFFSSPPKGIGV